MKIKEFFGSKRNWVILLQSVLIMFEQFGKQ